MDFPKLKEIKPGDKLKADGGFTCLNDGEVCEVKKDDHGAYIECRDGKHYLDGHEGYRPEDQGQCVGFWRT